MILLKQGSEYTLDGIKHKIPDDEIIIGRPLRYTEEHEGFLIKIKNMLRHFHERAEQHGITYYMCCGTLLGAIELGGIIPWDDDGDVSILPSEVGKIEKAFENSPYKLIKFKYGYKLADPTFPYYPFVDIMVVDLDPKEEIPSYRFSYPLNKGKPTFRLRWAFPNKVHPHDMIFPLKLYDFEGFKLWGPKDAVSFCKKSYGEDCLKMLKIKKINTHMFTSLFNF